MSIGFTTLTNKHETGLYNINPTTGK